MPMHAPASVLYPGKWVFYDVDLDAVREQLAVGNVYMAGHGETQDEFKERENFKHLLEEHINRRNRKIPEHGSYEYPYLREEPRDVVAFEKMLGRITEQVGEEEDLEGDVLVLNPAKIGKHIPDIIFDRQLGRVKPKVDEN